MQEAQYDALLSRATDTTRYERLWEISLVEGWHLILAGNILEGGSYIWPDPRLSSGGRQMLLVREVCEQIETHGLAGMVDL